DKINEANLRIGSFQNLRVGLRSLYDTPLMLPQFTLNSYNIASIKKIQISNFLDGLLLKRMGYGLETARISNKLKASNSYTSSTGHTFSAIAAMRVDAYHQEYNNTPPFLAENE